MANNNIRITSYNCHGAKNKLPVLNTLTRNAHIVFLQETWLLPNELSVLDNINPTYNYFSLSSVDVESGVLVGRPYGGISVLWEKNLSSMCQVLTFDDDRILGLSIIVSNIKYLLLKNLS